MEQHSHRPDTHKPNKPFKSRHATKGNLKKDQKGKVSGAANNRKLITLNTLSKVDRKHVASLIQRQKRNQIQTQSRIFAQCPKIIAVIPLSKDTDAFHYTATFSPDASSPITIINAKRKLQFIPNTRNLLNILDSVKVADYVCFLLSAKEEVDHFGDLCIRSIKAQGVPTIFSVVQHLGSVPIKRQTLVKKSLSSFMQHHFAGDLRLFDNDRDTETMLRFISSQSSKPVVWRERHSYLLGEQVEYIPGSAIDTTGTLVLKGFLRGKNLSANSLIHIQNHGDFQIEKISCNESSDHHNSAMALDETIAIPDSRQESLVTQIEPDYMDNEQTWPTDQELKEAERTVDKMRKRVKVPKGTSAYQAAWIVDSESEGEDSNDEMDSSDDLCNQVNLPAIADNVEADDVEADDVEADDVDADEVEEKEEIYLDEEDNASSQASDIDLDIEEEERQYREYMLQKSKEKNAKDDLEFPDEMDTPMDNPARIRFQRYRGLKSFRTSPWDPYENLPVDYSRIFQFQNFLRTRKNVLKNLERLDPMEDHCVMQSGSYVSVHIAKVPEQAFRDFQISTTPKIIFSLLPHEQKMSVMNFSITRPSMMSIAESLAESAGKDAETKSILTESNSGAIQADNISIKMSSFKLPQSYIIKAKDPLLMCCGFRRYIVRPIYSTTSRGSTNNVHKFSRFLQPGQTSVGSIYAPIQFAPSPITLFKISEEYSTPILIGAGSVLNNDPTRILTKRIILTGHPFKVHKRSATIRYMFHNPADIDYFKPVELFTKYGRKGHIRERLGTHGYMKCLFDTQISQQDTVCMYLFKRVFPKWDTALFDASTVSKAFDDDKRTSIMMEE